MATKPYNPIMLYCFHKPYSIHVQNKILEWITTIPPPCWCFLKKGSLNSLMYEKEKEDDDGFLLLQ